MSTKSVKSTKSNSMEWPTFLDSSILEVIENDFKFKSMTPVQVINFNFKNIQ